MGAKMMIVMRRDLKMRKGKIAAQAGHACIDAVLQALKKEDRMSDLEMSADGMILKTDGKQTSPLCEWFNSGCTKVAFTSIPRRSCSGSQKKPSRAESSPPSSPIGDSPNSTASTQKPASPSSPCPQRSRMS